MSKQENKASVKIIQPTIVTDSAFSPHSSVPHTREQIDYVNYTRFPITVLNEGNIPLFIPPISLGNIAPKPEDKFFIHRTVYLNCLDGNYLNFIISKLEKRKDSLGGGSSIDSIYINHAISSIMSLAGSETIITLTFTKEILSKDIEGNPYIYINEDNIVIYNSNNEEIMHPLCSVERSKDKFREVTNNMSNVNGSLIEIVDNKNIINTRFINMLGKAMAIYPVQDIDKNDGLYIHNLTSEYGKPIWKVEYIKFPENDDDVNEFLNNNGLFSNKMDAETYGNPKTIMDLKIEEYKQKNLELQHATNVYKQEQLNNEKEIALLKARLDKEKEESKLEHEKRINELREEYSKRKLDREDYYDSRDRYRKDSSESWKFVVTLTVGLVGLLTALFKK